MIQVRSKNTAALSHIKTASILKVYKLINILLLVSNLHVRLFNMPCRTDDRILITPVPFWLNDENVPI